MVSPRDCQHQNIYWEDFFKEGKLKADGKINNDFQWHDICCLDCGETKGQDFAMAAQIWYYKKIQEWLIDNGLAKRMISAAGDEFCHDSDFIRLSPKNLESAVIVILWFVSS